MFAEIIGKNNEGFIINLNAIKLIDDDEYRCRMSFEGGIKLDIIKYEENMKLYHKGFIVINF